jgi:hypothetical protein
MLPIGYAAVSGVSNQVRTLGAARREELVRGAKSG